jgi:hypothetical protein
MIGEVRALALLRTLRADDADDADDDAVVVRRGDVGKPSGIAVRGGDGRQRRNRATLTPCHR